MQISGIILVVAGIICCLGQACVARYTWKKYLEPLKTIETQYRYKRKNKKRKKK